MRKLFTFLAVVAIIAGFVGLFKWHNDEKNARYEYTETTTHYVRSGDTIWTVAQDYCDNRHDIRQVIWQIQQLSDIKGGMIHPGDILVIPLYHIMENGG